MRVPPQVSDRIKEAPAQALRGVFAGIGQVLLITDKLRNKTPAQAPQARAPQPAQPRSEPVPPAPPAAQAPATPPTASAPPVPPTDGVTAARDLDQTGNVRLLTSEEAEAGSTAPTVDAMTPVGNGVPLPNYDELSIASLRARLRNLDVPQLRQLVEYESAHAGRADVITMFERRIAKLQAETPAEARGAAAKVYRGEAEAEAEAEAREDVEAEVQEEVGAEAEGEE
jgi:hypothetical protein